MYVCNHGRTQKCNFCVSVCKTNFIDHHTPNTIHGFRGSILVCEMQDTQKVRELDINFTQKAFAHNTRKNARQCEPSKTFFFRLDKNYRPREYDKTNKVLPLYQTKNISAGMNEALYLCDICNKKYKSQSGLKRHRKNGTQDETALEMKSPILLHRWKTHQLKIVNSRSPQDLNGGNTKKLNL